MLKIFLSLQTHLLAYYKKQKLNKPKVLQQESLALFIQLFYIVSRQKYKFKRGGDRCGGKRVGRRNKKISLYLFCCHSYVEGQICQLGWYARIDLGTPHPPPKFIFLVILYFIFVVRPPFSLISLTILTQIATIQPKNLTKTIKIYTMVIAFQQENNFTTKEQKNHVLLKKLKLKLNFLQLQ